LALKEDAMGTREPDYVLLGAVLGLLAIGTVMVFSASAAEALAQYQNPYYFLERQLMWAGLGLLVMTYLSRFDYWRLLRWAFPAFVVAVLGLLLVLVPHIGLDINGARRWVKLGPLVVQPSEFAKLAVVVLYAGLLTRHQARITDFWRGIVPLLGLGVVVLLLVLAEPDLGTTVAIGATIVVMLFAAGAQLKHLGGLALAGLPALAWAALGEAYRRQRILAFLDFTPSKRCWPWAPAGFSASGSAIRCRRSDICPKTTPTLSLPSSARNWACWAR
jgi:cell division protein FtsW